MLSTSIMLLKINIGLLIIIRFNHLVLLFKNGNISSIIGNNNFKTY